MHKKHFFLSNNIAEARDFSPRNPYLGDHSLPTRDRAEHGQMVKGQYEIAVNQAIAHLEERENLTCNPTNFRIFVASLLSYKKRV